MRQVVAAAVMMAACVGCAFAAGYDDFTQAVAADLRGDLDAAITGYTAALNDGDLARPYIPTAHRMRAFAYFTKNKCREALTDLDAVAALVPLDRVDLQSRARAKSCLGDFAGAKQDIEAAMGPVPEPEQYEALGRAEWQRGFFADAYINLAKAAELTPKNDAGQSMYTVVWYALVAGRVGKLDPTTLAKYVDDFSISDWPMPLLDLYRGKLKPDEVHPSARQSDTGKYSGQVCEADFYIGEWHIVRGSAEVAKPLIAHAAAECPKNFIEYYAAQAEASRLGLPRSKEVKP